VLLHDPSVLTVFLVRQLPIAGVVPNLVLGVTPVKHRVFLIGSFLGLLPATVLVSLIGSGLGKPSLLHSLGQLTTALAVLALAAVLVWRLRPRRAVPT
jgi:uncharacterized membrane protein YdjX (TVP38/TMEM64 family)